MNAITKFKRHYVASEILSPTNAVAVNLIGCGGTGSRVLRELAVIHHALRTFQHPGLQVRVFDSDQVSEANIGRGFSPAEVRLHKAPLLASRINREYGTNWKGVPMDFCMSNLVRIEKYSAAAITIGCVDQVSSRFEIAAILQQVQQAARHDRDRPYYYMDFGNSRATGQVILSTIGDVEQPVSTRYETVASIPLLTDEFGDLLKSSGQQDDTPSCSLPQALEKQDLFINPALAVLGKSLLWKMFRKGNINIRGFFLDLENFRLQPLLVE